MSREGNEVAAYLAESVQQVHQVRVDQLRGTEG